MESLSWNKTGEWYHLSSPREELVKIQYKKANQIVFWINDEPYELKRSGLWNQRYVVLRNKQELVSVAHNFWGSKGRIIFPDGTQYTSDYKYKNTLTLRFLDGESEILSYHVGMEDGKRKAVINLGVALVDAEKILLLATLGMVMFLNIFSEFNDDGNGDLLVMVAAAS